LLKIKSLKPDPDEREFSIEREVGKQYEDEGGDAIEKEKKKIGEEEK
jgi:hypothetical protein